MSRRQILAVLLCALIAVSIGAQTTKTYKIAYIPTSIGQPNTNAWLEGMMRIFRKYPNVKVQSFDPQLRADLQVSFIDDVINQKYDAIVLQAQDAACLLYTSP
ncbi:MAG: hypothetical protein N2067_09370, partial [Spirochaetaceae bacterium]|nr:hypothetical protein [Spirochaetaceae bacterium]